MIKDVIDNIKNFKDLAEIKDYVRHRLPTEYHINAIARSSALLSQPGVTSWADDCWEPDEWVESADFLVTLISRPGCPEWLHRQIVWEALKQDLGDVGDHAHQVTKPYQR